MKKFNDKLKEVRRGKRFTQKDVYTKMGVSPNCYASWEQGRTEPNITNIKKLCDRLEVSADDLLCIEDDGNTPADK